jgi:sporulation protein YlmC with PRC-barrel domain
MELHVELLLGRCVFSRDGLSIGRIEEIRATEEGEITEFLVGEPALLERFAALGLIRYRKRGYRIRWDQLNWSNLDKPSLMCGIEELAA